MKSTIIFLMAIIIIKTTNLKAQTITKATGWYARLGISKLGNGSLDTKLSPNGNILLGNYGADIGLALDVGHLYYFGSYIAEDEVNFGLDWTILSITYNQLDNGKWYNYGIGSGATSVMPKGGKKSVSFATKVGPVLSFRPMEKFVVDARLQLAYVVRFSALDYFDQVGQSGRNFSFYNPDDSNYKYSRVSPSIAPNFGVTIRYKNYGLALDYLNSKVNTNFSAQDVNGPFLTGKEKIPTHDLQLKFSLNI